MTRTQRQIEQHRQGDAVVRVCDAAGRPLVGVRVWVEQEAHPFPFACAVPDLGALPDAGRARYLERLDRLFNDRWPLSRWPAEPDVMRVEVTEPVPLGRLRFHLDRLAATGQPLEVHVHGRAVGDSAEVAERDAARRAAELYTLCFAQPSVCGIVWHGFWDGEPGVRHSLLRRNMSPTPAYHYLGKLIHVAWHTRAEGVTDAEGQFCFRGFFGEYRVVVPAVDDQGATKAAVAGSLRFHKSENLSEARTTDLHLVV